MKIIRETVKILPCSLMDLMNFVCELNLMNSAHAQINVDAFREIEKHTFLNNKFKGPNARGFI